MEELTETIDFPNVSTTLIAYYRPLDSIERRERNLPLRPAFGSNQPLSGNERVAEWKLRMYFSGPDARYNGAIADLRPEPTHLKSTQELTTELEEALRKLDALAGQQFQGAYRKKIGKSGGYSPFKNPTLEIVSENGRSHLEIGAVSSTSYTWHRELNLDEVRKAIQVMKAIPALAITLISTLETIS